MWPETRVRGANAVVAMRFDCNENGDIMSEVACRLAMSGAKSRGWPAVWSWTMPS
jgi:uncharacterized protein YbjQ (UPF0145 family)